jgi:hypothetical protein
MQTTTPLNSLVQPTPLATFGISKKQRYEDFVKIFKREKFTATTLLDHIKDLERQVDNCPNDTEGRRVKENLKAQIKAAKTYLKNLPDYQPEDI